MFSKDAGDIYIHIGSYVSSLWIPSKKELCYENHLLTEVYEEISR